MTLASMSAVLVAFVAFVFTYASDALGVFAPSLAENGFYLLVVSVLVYGNVVYLLCRLGHLRRLLVHRPASNTELYMANEGESPAVTILVPSFKEERRVVWQALMSACLQDYPNRRVVLLIDDPPEPASEDDAGILHAARRLPEEVGALLASQAELLERALEEYRGRSARGAIDARREAAYLADLHESASDWYRERLRELDIGDHTDTLFAEDVLRRPADDLDATADDLRRRANSLAPAFSDAELLGFYRRLAWLFRVEVTSFERKLYSNLSHEPNKAMNLNSYIALLGRSLREVVDESGRSLLDAPPTASTMDVPAADYVVTLDADSILLPQYVIRLVHLVEQPENGRVAVAQTPYSAIPGAPKTLERVAGATTDIQYIIHQGFTRYGSTYWVGANALIRKAALDDIMSYERDGNVWVRKYVQDRTVIEDTESSIDLADRGWGLLNYPARLAYSATPPDFGSLVIQRRRWANGGLIILPKLVRYLVRRPWRPSKLGEVFIRTHYLVSIAAANLALLVLLAYPFEAGLANLWLALTALPYFVLYARDLAALRYRRLDVLRVYALNLLLVPVNIAGVYKSLEQTLLRRKIPFGRTPKIRGRTAVSPLYLVAPCVIVLYCATGVGWDLAAERWTHAALSAAMASMLTYAIVRYIGLSALWEDLNQRRRQRETRSTTKQPRTLRPGPEHA